MKSTCSSDSEMIASVIARKQNSSKFHIYYDDLCKLHNLMPLRVITSHEQKDILDITGDKISFDEWFPIAKAISCDRSLRLIAIRSRHKRTKEVKDLDGHLKSSIAANKPLIQTDFLTNIIINAVKKCLIGSSTLTCLMLEGLHFTRDTLSMLCTGLLKNSSVQTVSLQKSFIGDNGCQLLCDAVKKSQNIKYLDMSSCGVKEKGGYYISQLLKYQQLERYSEAWKDALRYRVANVDGMYGIRRISLNQNASLGDAGILHLIECLKDDLWLKAIDFQNCGITNYGALEILQLLKVNTVLTIIDIRNNHDVSNDLLNGITKLLAENNSKNVTEIQEYEWLPAELSSSQTHSLLRETSVICANKKRSMHHREKTKAKVLRAKSFCSVDRSRISQLSQQLNEEMQLRINAEERIQALTDQIIKMEMEIKKLREERDKYLRELTEINSDDSNHIILKTDTVDAINDAFDKLTTFLQQVKINTMSTSQQTPG